MLQIQSLNFQMTSQINCAMSFGKSLLLIFPLSMILINNSIQKQRKIYKTIRFRYPLNMFSINTQLDLQIHTKRGISNSNMHCYISASLQVLLGSTLKSFLPDILENSRQTNIYIHSVTVINDQYSGTPEARDFIEPGMCLY